MQAVTSSLLISFYDDDSCLRTDFRSLHVKYNVGALDRHLKGRLVVRNVVICLNAKPPELEPHIVSVHRQSVTNNPNKIPGLALRLKCCYGHSCT